MLALVYSRKSVYSKSPERWLSRSEIVIGRHSAGQAERYSQIESPKATLCCSCSSITAAAVKPLVIDMIGYW